MSDKILDADGQELTYWPITGLRAGEDSQHLTIQVPTPRASFLRAGANPLVTVFGRVGSVGPFTNLTTTGLDLSALAGPLREFEVYAHADSSVTGVERVALFIGARSSRAAAWLA